METSQSIRFLRRRNLGQYEHTELEVTDVVTDRSKLTSTIKEVMATVRDALYGMGEFAETKTSETAVDKVTKPKKEEVAKKSEESKTETPKQGEVVKPEEKPQVEEKKVEETKVEEKKEEPKKTAAPKKETTRVTKASKNTAYDRVLDTHKNNLGVYLDAAYPNWRHKDNIKKASDASKALQGTEFLDAEGNILDSFKEAFSKYMVDLV